MVVFVCKMAPVGIGWYLVVFGDIWLHVVAVYGFLVGTCWDLLIFGGICWKIVVFGGI